MNEQKEKACFKSNIQEHVNTRMKAHMLDGSLVPWSVRSHGNCFPNSLVFMN
jgi:hypothetical protein